ncbi:unnamed protein product [Cuscuta europaea]|uniref:Uncharacterized protein n=1 Tax=Cuscuta europaea TaxID=41803 RepID=A0A9P0ZQ26_CUSEU|nr:unnamed protein product [Cuscuta europaea]
MFTPLSPISISPFQHTTHIHLRVSQSFHRRSTTASPQPSIEFFFSFSRAELLNWLFCRSGMSTVKDDAPVTLSMPCYHHLRRFPAPTHKSPPSPPSLPCCTSLRRRRCPAAHLFAASALLPRISTSPLQMLGFCYLGLGR